MEKVQVDTAIEQIDESVNKTMDESEGLITIVLPTLVIILLLKKLLKYGNVNEKDIVGEENNKFSEKETNENIILKPCRLYEAICEAAFSSLSEIDISKKDSLPIIINKHCSHIPGHKHSHIQSFFSLYNNLGLNYIKHFINCTIVKFTPISYTIASRREMEYYKKRVVDEEHRNEILQKQLNFLDLKYRKLQEQLEYERNAREIYEKCHKDSKEKLEVKVNELEDVNESLKLRLEDSKKEKSLINQGCLFSDEENDDDDFQLSCNNNFVFKRQEEQRQNEEEANKLLSDLDQRGMDDFILKIQNGKYKFRDVAPFLLNQMFIGDLDAVQVSIELDQFVKQCKAKKKEVLCAIVEVICNLIEKRKQKKIHICALEVIQKYVALFQEYLGNTKKDKIHFLNIISRHCKTINTVKPVFVNIIEKLYKLNILDEDAILSWYGLHNKDNKEGIIDNEVFEDFIENLKIELLKKSMLVKKEYDNYYDYNDSGFCSDEEDFNVEITPESHLLVSENMEDDTYGQDHSYYESWEMIENQNIPCHCCNCNGKHIKLYDSSLLKEKSHVRFEEPNVPSNHILIQRSSKKSVVFDNEEEIVVSSYMDKSESDFGCCLLDIVKDDSDEEESDSFIIQDINGERIFSRNKELLDEDYYNNESDQSYASSISMNSIESQELHLNEETKHAYQTLNCCDYINHSDISENQHYCSIEDN